MTLVLIFLVNAALSFALSLLLAALLGPDGFARYAIGLSVTLVVNTAAFEWLRLSTTRFYSDRVRAEDAAVRRTLDRTYCLTGAGVVALFAALSLTGLDFGLSDGLLAAAGACGLAYGLCEYRMALSRARFLQGPYAVLGLLRALFGFVLAAGAAAVTRDPVWVLAGAAAAALLPILFVLRRLRDEAAFPFGRIDPSLLRTFARYGLPLVAASAVYQLLPLLNRSVLASRAGFVDAGYFSLASELVTRLFQNLGAALDLVLFQLVVRTEERSGRAEADRQVTRNAGIIAAILIPSGAGLWLVWPAFEAVFVPEAFRGRLAGVVTFLIPALMAFATVQYALNPVFQLRGRTGPVVAAALAAVALDGAVLVLWPGLSGAEAFAAAQLAGLALGLVMLSGFAVGAGARLPWRDAGAATAAAAIMVAALWPTRGVAAPLPTLVVQSAAGAILYGLLAILLDIAGVRAAVMSRLVRRDRPSPGARA